MVQCKTQPSITLIVSYAVREILLALIIVRSKMADTTTQECTKCGEETDCVEGLCQECYLDLETEAGLMTEKGQGDEGF